jgi:hypothetical protein
MFYNNIATSTGASVANRLKKLTANHLTPTLWVRIMTWSVDSFMLGSYPAILRNVGGSTPFVPEIMHEGHLRKVAI